MTANYHTHTWRCRHAVGTETEYIEYAIRTGLKTLGFSDHTPYFFPGSHYSSFRMFPDQLEDYINTLLSLQKQYADRLTILIGLEVEYYPDLFPKLIDRLREFPIKYLLLGQHFTHNEVDGFYSGSVTEDPQVLIQYHDQIISAIHTGLFSYIAHPDLLHFVGDPNFYKAECRRLCREAKLCNIPLEMNLLGIHGNRHYPRNLFWEAAAEENNQVVLGCDAHTPEAVADTESKQKALEIIQKLNLDLLDTVSLRPIF